MAENVSMALSLALGQQSTEQPRNEVLTVSHTCIPVRYSPIELPATYGGANRGYQVLKPTRTPAPV